MFLGLRIFLLPMILKITFENTPFAENALLFMPISSPIMFLINLLKGKQFCIVLSYDFEIIYRTITLSKSRKISNLLHK